MATIYGDLVVVFYLIKGPLDRSISGGLITLRSSGCQISLYLVVALYFDLAIAKYFCIWWPPNNHVVEEFKKYNDTRFKNWNLYCTYRGLFSNFLICIIWFLIPSSLFFGSSFYFLIDFFGIFLVWVHFNPFYFLFVGESAFRSYDLDEYPYEDSDD